MGLLLSAKISHLVQNLAQCENFALVRNFQKTIFFFLEYTFFRKLCTGAIYASLIYLFSEDNFFFGIYIFKYINKRKVFFIYLTRLLINVHRGIVLVLFDKFFLLIPQRQLFFGQMY